MRKIKLDDRIKNRFNMIFGLIISKYGLFICILFFTTIYMIPKLLKNNSYENFIYAIVILLIVPLVLYFVDKWYTSTRFKKSEAIVIYFLKDIMIKKN